MNKATTNPSPRLASSDALFRSVRELGSAIRQVRGAPSQVPLHLKHLYTPTFWYQGRVRQG
jgi:hypothetical protein